MPEIRKGRVGDFIRGADTWLHGQQMFLFSFAWLILLGLILAAVVSFIYVWVSMDKCALSNTVTYYWAHLKGMIHPFSSVSISECVPIEGNGTLPLKLVTEEQFFKSAASNVIGQFGLSFIVVLVLYIPIGVFLAIKAARRGKEIKEDKFIRGAKLVSDDELKREVISKHGASELSLQYIPARCRPMIDSYRVPMPSADAWSSILGSAGFDHKFAVRVINNLSVENRNCMPTDTALQTALKKAGHNPDDANSDNRFIRLLCGLDEYANRRRSEFIASLAEEFPLPSAFSKKHTLISGTTGAGKSTALTHLLKAIRARGDRAVVYDKKGEFVEKFYRDGVDHILNPSDSRSHQWTPWEEMASPFDADWIGETLFPQDSSNGGGNDKFFTNAARNVVSSALQTLYLDGPRSVLTLLQATAWNDAELLQELVAGTPASAYFNEDNEKTLESIRSTIVDGVRPLRLLKEKESQGFFSIRNWIAEGDGQNADDSWLFLPVRESDIEIQKPLISTWIQSTAKGLMARGVDKDRTLWLIVDELPSLKKIPALSMLMAEGRGFGAAVVLGIQEINQLEEEFGKNTSKTILGLCSTQLHFRLNNSDTAEWVSKVLGEAEREEIDEDLNYSADDIRDGVRVSSKRQSRKIVLPSEIMDLPDLSCYAKIWGVEGKARIDVPFLPLQSISEGFIQGDENETVGMRLLNSARAWKGTSVTESVLNEQTIETEDLEPREESQEKPSGNTQREVQKILDSMGMDNDFLFSDLLGDRKS